MEEQKLIEESCAKEEDEKSRKKADEIAKEWLENNQEPRDNRPGQVYAGNKSITTENGGHMEYATEHTPNLSFQDSGDTIYTCL